MAKGNIGTVVQVIGPVLDIRFKDGELPQLLNAVEVESGEKKLTVEVAQHIGNDVVRCIAMSSTDGLTRGAKATDTGAAITVPQYRFCCASTPPRSPAETSTAMKSTSGYSSCA